MRTYHTNACGTLLSTETYESLVETATTHTSPAWVSRMKKASDHAGYECSGFEANMVAKAWEDNQAEIARLRGLIKKVIAGNWCITELQEALGHEE